MRWLIWGLLGLVMCVPVILAGFSPLLAWRAPIYIVAGFAGIAAMALMAVQPLLGAGTLHGLARATSRRLHRWIGPALLALVGLHIAGLWITSPPDMVDAVLLRAPAAFSVWGVVALVGLVAAAVVASARKVMRVPWRLWRRAHLACVIVAVIGTALHALLAFGAMETWSKSVLSAWIVLATAFAALRVDRGASRRPAVETHAPQLPTKTVGKD